jgi:glycosyltransferase involved in cell wall biosynthesis
MALERDHSFAACSVVVCTRNRAVELDRCLRSLQGQDYPSFEIIVVDSASSEELTREVARRNGVRYVLEKRAGLSRARNRGAREAKFDIIAYLDDDAEAQPGWLRALAEEFCDARVMAATGRILPQQDDSEGARIAAAMGILDRGPARKVVDGDMPDWIAMTLAGIGSGANMAFRRDAFFIWSGFDTRLGLGAAIGGAEEDYAFLSLIKRGYRVVYTPAAIVSHPFPETLTLLRRRHLLTVATSSGAFAFMLLHERHHRREILRYIIAHLRRSRRGVYRRSPEAAAKLAPAWREALAAVAGLGRFAGCALRRNRQNSMNDAPMCPPLPLEDRLRQMSRIEPAAAVVTGKKTPSCGSIV